MTTSLGLDIGSNSVGSAWVDTDAGVIECGVTVFPSGVEEKDDERGEPVGRVRRGKRMLRRIIRRRAMRRRRLLAELVKRGLLPSGDGERLHLLCGKRGKEHISPWHLRREGLERELTPCEFGRVLVHLNQRRGAFGVRVEAEVESEEKGEMNDKKGKKPKDDEGKVRESIERLNKSLAGRTFGQFIADEYDKREQAVSGSEGKFFQNAPIRNRRESYQYCASRDVIRDEFLRLWKKQELFGGKLAGVLTVEFKRILDDPSPSDPKVAAIWRHAGIIFGQRRHYWNVGTLGRCDLEPTDRCCPVGDMHASYFRVLQTVNNLRLWVRGENEPRKLDEKQRAAVIKKLREEKTESVPAVRKALGIDKAALKKRKEPEDFYRLNIEADSDAEVNTDWFWREVVVGVFGEDEWNKLGETQREAVNRALLRLDPETDGDGGKLKELGMMKWWGLSDVKAEKLVAVWERRPKVEKRLKLSRKAVSNLRPYMETGLSVTEARQEFAENASSQATLEQRARYAHWVSAKLRQTLLEEAGGDEDAVKRLLRLRGLSSADRHYLRKHPDLLPPAPELPNPVVRKAIHEVRRHVLAHMRKHKCKPDRIVIELSRDSTQPKKLRDRLLVLNRMREKKRKEIIRDFKLGELSKSQREKAVDRVILCRQQRYVSAYSETKESDFVSAYECLPISERNAADGFHPVHGALERDHIVPRASGGADGLNNRVLCYVKENRNKGKQSPLAWLAKERFERMEAVFRHLETTAKSRKGMDTSGYFMSRDCEQKWNNLHRVAKPEDEWRSSQMTDTSYAAAAVAAYLQSSLYPDDPIEEDGKTKRRIYFTKGRYTAKLRRDWRLFERLRSKGEAQADEAENKLMEAKNRGDHRHHAIDAVVVALTVPGVIDEVGKRIREYDERRFEARERGWDEGAVAKPLAMEVPGAWQNVGAFRHVVLSRMYDEFDASDNQGRPLGRRERVAGETGTGLPWGVAHRPVKRKLVGALHLDTLYGPVLTDGTSFTARKRVADLKPGYLKLSGIQLDAWKAGRMPLAEDDANTGPNSYLVRDLGLRLIIRKCLEDKGVKPDKFIDKELKAVIEGNGLQHGSLAYSTAAGWKLNRTGVPIKAVVCLRTISDPVRIKAGPRAGMKADGRGDRVYIGGKNHHIEIRATDGRQWKGEVVRMYEAAERNGGFLTGLKKEIAAIKALRLARDDEKLKIKEATKRMLTEHPIVDRRDGIGGHFVMSLADGETLWMKHPETKIPGYFVVFKIDGGGAVHFVHHSDARRDMGSKDDDGKLIEGSQREDIGKGIRASELQTLGVDPFKRPVKVRVSPLGEVKVLERD